ncbi:MAG: response regulator [Planctomycetota bacterium]
MTDILIVDDSGTVREIIMRGIRQAGFKVENFAEAGDGAAGLEILESNSVDLILSDIDMPDMNGLDFVKNVREKHGDATPIVMITTEGSEDIVSEAKSLGADGHLEQPFSSDKIQEILGPHLS